MKILAFSDIIKWERYEELLDRIQPDVIALAGDLTSDGFASFWSEAIKQIPEFQKERRELMRKLGVVLTTKGMFDCSKNKNLVEWSEKLTLLEDKYRDTKEFLEVRKRIHVDKFYQFLKYAGKKSKILVVKGDHDEDFKGDYIPKKINKIFGCKEISGKIIEIKGFHFLGLGFNETHYIRTLKPIIEEFKRKVDVIITHCEQNKIPTVSLLEPKIIIRGHFGYGKYLVNNIPSVFTVGVKYTIIELKNKKIPKILQYRIGLDNKIKIVKRSSCRPWFSEVSEFERYKWLKPYPGI